MIQSIYAGVSALQSYQTGIDVLANNIANVNTVGFKGRGTEFTNLFEQKISQNSITNSTQVGLGVKVSATPLDLSIGSYTQTEIDTDLAIAGKDGWFGLRGGTNNDEYFTRAGNFKLDPYADTSSVRLVSAEGFFVTGTLANNTNNGILNPPVQALELDLSTVQSQDALIFPAELTYPVEATTQADFFGNLGLTAVPRAISSTVISPQSQRNNLRLEFTQTIPQPISGASWDVTATTQNANGSIVYDTQTGVVTFDNTGALLNSTLGTIDNDGAPIIINLGTDFGGIVSNSGPSVSTSSTANGTLAGDLIKYSVNRNGEVVASFTNSRQSVVGKVAIYHFQNDQGLESVSGTKFKTSSNSGQPIFYDTNNGQILSRTLETSNVTLEVALTELIIMQRSYDAASKTVSTADQMLKNALNM
ncbi:flagellar hook protein FlgE [Sulfurimonas sp. MAG313]|nr:flagellar hook-basal body complex protein [Sulfurimonas sp. MAG313]MDF1880949.1 flagellar hook protein FlgE [Sulfurimonas sp. MAG313]